MRARPRRRSFATRRRIGAGAGVLAMTVLTGGCGFMNALAAPAPPPSSVPTVASGPTATPPTAPALVAAADLVASSNGRPASLAVTVSPPHDGVPPLQTMNGLLTEDCHLAADASQYETVTVDFTDRGPADTRQDDEASNLRLDVAAPAGSGIGVFVQDTAGVYCQGAATMPTQTILQTQDLASEHQAVIVYVIGRTSSATHDPLHGVTLQLGHPRRNPDVINARSWTWNVQRVTTGSACPGEPDSLCVPLG